MLIDTGYLIGLVDPRDERRNRCLAWSQQLRVPLMLHSYVTLELLNHLSTSPLIREAYRLLDALVISPEVTWVFVDEALHRDAIQFHRERADKRWSLTDCVSFTLMERLGIRQALAYDYHFAQAGFEPLLRHDPVAG